MFVCDKHSRIKTSVPWKLHQVVRFIKVSIQISTTKIHIKLGETGVSRDTGKSGTVERKIENINKLKKKLYYNMQNNVI
jgi:hypothetical protein